VRGGARQAVILAGGQGTRLRPLTLARAKPVVPILNRPLLAYQLALLRAHGVSDVVLACSYRVDDVRVALGDGQGLGVRLRYVVEDEPLGTGGGARRAADLTAGPLFVLNGDVLTDADLTAMRRLHEARGSRTTIFLQPVDDPRQFGLVETDADGRLRRFREKPTAEEEITTNTINAGIYLIDAPLLARIPPDRPSSIEREFFPALIAEGITSYGWCPRTYWRDLGDPVAYRAGHIDLLEGLVARGMRFDAALSIWVLQHCAMPAEDVARIKSAIKPGGDLFVANGNLRSVPTAEQGWVNDGLDVKAMLAGEFETVRLGGFAREQTTEIIAEGTFWGAYRRG